MKTVIKPDIYNVELVLGMHVLHAVLMCEKVCLEQVLPTVLGTTLTYNTIL